MPTVLGHTASKNDAVAQTEWWEAKQDLLSNSKVIEQSFQGGREPEKVARAVPRAGGFQRLAGQRLQSD